MKSLKVNLMGWLTAGMNSVVTHREKTKRAVIKCKLLRVRFVPKQLLISWFPLDINVQKPRFIIGQFAPFVTKLRYVHIQIYTHKREHIYTVQQLHKAHVKKQSLVEQFWSKISLNFFYLLILTLIVSSHRAHILRTP